MNGKVAARMAKERAIEKSHMAAVVRLKSRVFRR
jgi:hypothetical protein